MVIWIIGKSGSGKTFFAKKIFEILNKKKKCFLIDGDDVRKYLNYDLTYSISDRKINSRRIQDLCLYFEEKKYLVICSIQSIFKKHQLENKKKFNKYKQIYLNVDEKIFKKRKFKLHKYRKNVVGKETFRRINQIKSELYKIHGLGEMSNKTQREVLSLFNNSNKTEKDKEEFMKKREELLKEHHKLIDKWNTLNSELLLLLPKRHIIIENPDGTKSIAHRPDTRYSNFNFFNSKSNNPNSGGKNKSNKQNIQNKQNKKNKK